MTTYGIYGSHRSEGCPLFNRENRQLVLKVIDDFKEKAQQYRVNIKEQYHSGLEHTFIWIAEAESAHSIQDLMIETGVARFNALKIVPLRTFQNVIEACKKLEESSA